MRSILLDIPDFERIWSLQERCLGLLGGVVLRLLRWLGTLAGGTRVFDREQWCRSAVVFLERCGGIRGQVRPCCNSRGFFGRGLESDKIDKKQLFDLKESRLLLPTSRAGELSGARRF